MLQSELRKATIKDKKKIKDVTIIDDQDFNNLSRHMPKAFKRRCELRKITVKGRKKIEAFIIKDDHDFNNLPRIRVEEVKRRVIRHSKIKNQSSYIGFDEEIHSIQRAINTLKNCSNVNLERYEHLKDI